MRKISLVILLLLSGCEQMAEDNARNFYSDCEKGETADFDKFDSLACIAHLMAKETRK